MDPPAEGFYCSEGLQLARELLRPQLPHDIHDYILQGICKALDGTHVLAVIKTGGGKSSYFYGYFLLLKALQKMHPPCPRLKRCYPKNPAMVVIFPTKGLEEEMESKFKRLDITAVAINEDTLVAARRTKRNLWQECIEDISMVLLSPEQLCSYPFDRLLQNQVFARRLCALGIDEVHLVQDWGDSSFREAFRQIALVHARMPRNTTLIALTATLLAGEETTDLIKTLGLTPGKFFFQRRSNARPEVQEIYRVLRHGLAGWTFPDLDWIIDGNRKTIIYCGSFSICFRLRLYYHHRAPRKIVRIYNSLCFPSYNSETRRLFVEDPDTQIIIATDALVVGIDFPNVEDVVDLDCKHPNHGKQRKGRAGRPGGNVVNARGISYVTKATMERAKKMVAKPNLLEGGKWVNQGLHIGMAKLLTSLCYPACDDILYDNPSADIPCFCQSCASATQQLAKDKCDCSHCQPEPALQPLPRATQTLPPISMELRLTEKMTKRGTRRLQKFREHLWIERHAEIGFLPPLAFLPDAHIKALLNNFARLETVNSLDPFIHDLHLLIGEETKLFAVVVELRAIFATFPPPERKTRKATNSVLSTASIATGSRATWVDPTPDSSSSVSLPTYDAFWSTFQRHAQPLTVQPESMTNVAPSTNSESTIPSKRAYQQDSSHPPSPRETRRAKRGKENK